MQQKEKVQETKLDKESNIKKVNLESEQPSTEERHGITVQVHVGLQFPNKD